MSLAAEKSYDCRSGDAGSVEMQKALRRVALRAYQTIDVVQARSPSDALVWAVDSAIETLDDEMTGVPYSAIPSRIIVEQNNSASFVPMLAATLLSRIEARAAVRPLPLSNIAAFESQAQRILDLCVRRASDDWSLTNDEVQKEIGLCRLELFACEAQVAEKCQGPSLRSLQGQNLDTLKSFGLHLLSHGFRRRSYFEIHTHSPMLDRFNEQGWTNCYLMLADFLELYPDVAGIVASSWFFDPQLAAVSPRLAYLRNVPLGGRAIFLRGATSQSDVELATSKSETRRRLYEAGDYRPVNCSFLWQRQDVIRWAQALKSRTGISI